ncbi:unnamed protein product [Toxocara canis]|uniref:Remorin_C domain-containing protein n=1 Tax=Toxocara canis TaxID=6265 RepID=A0A183U5T2_TOXCA|nr:unnamed protein product [Toxocara canis]
MKCSIALSAWISQAWGSFELYAELAHIRFYFHRRPSQVPEHIDVNDWEKFGKEDLRKLIVKTVADMEKIDEQRREQFKEYEMQKKAEADHKMKVFCEPAEIPTSLISYRPEMAVFVVLLVKHPLEAQSSVTSNNPQRC